MPKMKLTVYIPCYNAAEYLEKSIGSLLGQTRPPDEILIIDDGSTDKSVEIASSFPVKVVRHERNEGLAAARNTAFRNASHELVGAIDADVYPNKDWLEQLLRPFSDPQVVGTGGRLIEAFRETPADAWRALQLCQDLGEQRIVIDGDSHKCLGGFGTILKKNIVQEIGGYNESYRTNFEDVDLCGRLVRAGHRLVFEPRAIAYHQRQDTVHSVIRTAWNWDFYFHYFNGGYNRIWLKILFNFRLARALMWNHARSGRFALLPVDLRLPFQHSGMDLRYHFSPSRLAPVQVAPGQSAVYVPLPFRGHFSNESFHS
jgi:glycosyltransferase involved in cell wall biosynthesis